MPFARCLVDLLPEMKSTCVGSPLLPAEVPEAVKSFSSWPEVLRDEWQFVDFGENLPVLTGKTVISRSLRIGGESFLIASGKSNS